MKISRRVIKLLGAAVITCTASVLASSSSTSSECIQAWAGDGYCDLDNNKEECGTYVGGGNLGKSTLPGRSPPTKDVSTLHDEKTLATNDNGPAR